LKVDKADRSPTKANTTEASASLSDLSPTLDDLWSQFPMVQCAAGHVTFTFLSCDHDSYCGAQQQDFLCSTFAQTGNMDVKNRSSNDDHGSGNAGNSSGAISDKGIVFFSQPYSHPLIKKKIIMYFSCPHFRNMCFAVKTFSLIHFIERKFDCKLMSLHDTVR
jgi:hypothetical protein